MSMRALTTAATGMRAHEVQTDVIANNLANISTTGFKKMSASFEDLLYQHEERLGTAVGSSVIPAGVQVGLGVQTSAVYSIPTQGELKQTERDLDIAITGRGYFRVTRNDGSSAYTRAGTFKRDNAGQIITENGDIVSPGITIPGTAKSVDINAEGVVQYLPPGVPETWETAGTLELALFVNEAGLKSIGQNLFVETPSSGAPVIAAPGADGNGKLLQGWLETSNVNAINEITSLISAQRGYELCSKVIAAGDEMMQTANNAKR